jgi:hypothetical protein
MREKVTINLPPFVLNAAEKRAVEMHVSKAEYIAKIVEWWYGQNRPPISELERSRQKELETGPTKPVPQKKAAA